MGPVKDQDLQIPPDETQTHAPAKRHAVREWTLLFTALVMGVALALFVFIVPLPYVIYSPGPTVNVLGEQGGQPILEVEGGSVDPADGELRLVTIGERGGPGKGSVTLADIIAAWIKPGYDVKTYESVYGKHDLTAEQVEEASQAQMQSSQSTAPIAALDYLGYDLQATITVAAAVEGSPAVDVFQPGDELVSIRTPDGQVHPMNRPSAPFSLMETIPPGTELDVTVIRDGAQEVIPVASYADPTNPAGDGSKLGLLLTVDAPLPLDVQFHLEKIGGPSAGTVFALGVVDLLSDGPLTAGKSIAATGTVDYAGHVGPIGGIVPKMYGASRDGAEWFLAPADNCAEVQGNIPRGLEVVSVRTLADAVAAVEAIADNEASGLPRCSDISAQS